MKRFLFLLVASAVFAAPVSAATLQEAMVQAYGTNPTLQKQRNALRAIDEQVPLAKSAARPSVDADASLGQAWTDVAGTGRHTTPRGLGVSVTQPIYKGGSIEAGITSAEKTVMQQRALLQSGEQALFLSVAQAYFDVARDQAVLRLNKKNEQVLGKEQQAAGDRLKVGEATRTDISQADSRLSGAVADRIQAEGRLAVSKATYLRIVGAEPGDIDLPKPDISLPTTLPEAISKSENNRPEVIAARYAEESARSDIDVAEGGLLPEVNINASAGRDWDQGTASGRVDSAVVAAQLVVPLYRAGADYARTRAAKETASQRRVEVREAMDLARENTVAAWQDLMTARATITARQKQIKASDVALTGVREESSNGTRTVLDRLNAEAEALQSQVDLVQAQRDEILAVFRLKGAVGELTAEKLGLPLTPYDPAAHYEEVKDKWLGLGSETPDSPAASPKP
jgi:outer membrane protein/adhesin transport system outer membrane protein